MPFFGKVYGAGISWKGRLNGAAVFIIPPGAELDNRHLITFFIRQVAGFLSRSEAEAALKESEEKFSSAFHSSAVLMAISTKSDGKFLDVNQTFLTTLGFSRDEVIGKGVDELLEVAAPFFAFRGLVMASPVWYPTLDERVRRALFDFILGVLDAPAFDPARARGEHRVLEIREPGEQGRHLRIRCHGIPVHGPGDPRHPRLRGEHRGRPPLPHLAEGQ